MKLTESHLRQIIRQELKKVMGLNEAIAEIDYEKIDIDVQKLINLLTKAGGYDVAVKDLTKRFLNNPSLRVYGKKSQFLNRDPEPTLFSLPHGSEDSAENRYQNFPIEILKRSQDFRAKRSSAGMSQDRPNQ